MLQYFTPKGTVVKNLKHLSNKPFSKSFLPLCVKG